MTDQTTQQHAQGIADTQSGDEGLSLFDVATEYAIAHVRSLSIGLLAVALVILTVEAIKPPVKWMLARFGIDEDIEDIVLGTLPYLIGIALSLVLDFGRHFYSMTGVQLSSFSAVLVGTIVTGGLAHRTYILAKQLRFVQTLQVRWRRFTRVTQDDLDALRKREEDSE